MIALLKNSGQWPNVWGVQRKEEERRWLLWFGGKSRDAELFSSEKKMTVCLDTTAMNWS
jgi:hypothetical protein